MVDNFFKLLIPVTKSNVADTKTIELCGESWTLVEFERLSDAPPYTCVSYSWGTKRVVNKLNDNQEISDRTIPVVETVIKTLQSSECHNSALQSLFSSKKVADKLVLMKNASHAIWIDSLCMPEQQFAADMCIHNMGNIYREATQVFVVLNTACDETIHKIYKKKPLNINDYLAIANDDWIDRIWTYQEFANSKMMFIVSENKEDTFVSEFQFLNSLMTYEAAYKNIQDTELTQKLERWQLLVAEQNIDERSVFQIISATHRRRPPEYPEDRINAIVSVISDENIDIWDKHSMTQTEYFMSICEKMGDYSFIFSTNPRSEIPGRKWRPLDDKIIPVISDVVTLGKGRLTGILKDTHLQMNNMCHMTTHKSNLVTTIEKFVKEDFSKKILKKLREKGFTGCGEHIILENGYFFPQKSHEDSKDLFVAISPDIKFSFGAPGLLLRSNDTDINQFCDVGVFIGKIPTSSENINVS